MIKTGLAAFAAIAFATSASAATIQDPFVKDQAVLQLKGIDLSTPEGQVRLANRSDQAARAVCGDRVASIHLTLEKEARDCRVAVLAKIRTQIEARTAMGATGSNVFLASLR